MAGNYEWFLRADLTAYEGKYVAIAGESVVASGDDPGEVYERGKAARPGEEVILWKVPVGETFVFLLKIPRTRKKVAGTVSSFTALPTHASRN